MRNSKFTFFVLALLLAITTTFTAFSSVAIKTNADDNVQNYRLSEEIAKLTSIDSLDESPIGLYASVYWCGPYLQWTYQSLDGSADVGIANYSKIQVSDSLSITPSGATAGINSVFSYTGNHSVGAAGCGDADRTWAISWTAPKTGVVTVKSGNLTIKGATNASDLSIGFSKGARTHIKPDDASLNWVNYPATVGETYPIADSSFSVSKGETVFINLYAKTKGELGNESEKSVSFSYDPVFSFTPAPENLHTYNHVQKLTKDENGALINNATITLDDDTTYPFSYLYRSTFGSEYGIAGQEHAMPVGEMVKAGVSIDPTGLRLFAPETYSGFLETGTIVNVSRSPDPMNVILGFTAPYEGELTISDLFFNYGIYPNKTNGYKDVNGRVHNTAYKGVAFRVLLNGKQVWPKDGGWDKSLAKLYESETDGYAVGDLIKSQRTYDLSGIKVKKLDKVYLELTRADLSTTEDCDTIEFNPTFTIDTNADTSDYVLYTTASDYFDITNSNDAESLISYWSINTKEGLYDRAVYSIMEAVDYSLLTYTSDILEDDASDIGWNYVRPKVGEDCAIGYFVPESGNLTISAETIFRGGNIALWEVYDLLSKGMQISTDGVKMRIEINGKRVWPVNSAWQEYTPKGELDINGLGVFNFEPVVLGVTAGDSVLIRFNAGESHLYDGFNFNPIFGLEQTQNPITNPTVTPDPTVESNSGKGGEKQSLLPIILIVAGVVFVCAVVVVILIIKTNKKAAFTSQDGQDCKDSQGEKEGNPEQKGEELSQETTPYEQKENQE